MKKAILVLCVLFLVSCGGNKPKAPDVPGSSPNPTEPSKPSSRPHINFGIDALGYLAAPYNAQNLVDALASIARSVPTGSVMDAFVDKNNPGRFDKYRTLFASGVTHMHRFHGLDATCVRNKTCWSGSVLAGYSIGRVEQEAMNPQSPLSLASCAYAAKAVALAKEFNIEPLYSPLLEDNLSRNAKLKLLQTTGACVPGLTLVDDNVTGYPKLPGYLKECHVGGNPLPKDCDIISFDGKSATEADIETFRVRYAGLKAILNWTPPENGRTIDEDPKVKPPAPPLRKHYISRDMHFWEARVLLPVQAPAGKPAWCPAPLGLDSRHLYKNFAEDKGTGDGRANKPLIIFPKCGPQTDVFDAKGNLAGSFKYYGPYSGGGERCYMAMGSGQSSYELGQKLEKSSGSEWAYVKEGGGCRMFNAYRRGGSFKSLFKSSKRLKLVKQAKKQSKAKQGAIQPLAL